jgi:hypothetical protein
MLLGCALIAILGMGAPRAAAVDPQQSVSITLTKVAPAVIKPDSKVVFRGKVTNTSHRPLLRLRASIWRNLVPLTNPSQLTVANRSAPTNPVGQRMYRHAGASTDLFTESQPELAPGASVRFRLHAKATELFRTPTPNRGNYLAGIEVQENGKMIGRSRTYLPVESQHPADRWKKTKTGRESRIDTATLVKLTATPTMAHPNTFVDDSLAKQISTGGRLDKLLTTVEQTNKASYAVDPNLITELQAMRDGYRVVDRHGKSTHGSGKPAAKSWLKRFTKMQRSHDGYRLPYAQPDLTALSRHRSKAETKTVVTDARRAASQVSSVADLPLMIAPPAGAVSPSLLSVAARSHVRVVLVSSDTTNNQHSVFSADDGLPLLSYQVAPVTGPGPDPRDTPVQQRQTWLASTYADALSGPHRDRQVTRLQVISDPGQGTPSNPSAPWLAHRSVADLLQGPRSRLTSQLNYPDRARHTELTSKQLDKMDSLARQLHTYRSLLADPKHVDPRIRQALPRTASVHWRGHPKKLARFRRQQARMLTTNKGQHASLDQLTHGDLVHVESNPHVTLTGATGTLPVTVVNKLNVAIRVRLKAHSPNRSRLAVHGLSRKKLGTVRPGSHRPARIRADAKSNGTLPVTLTLVNRDGERVGGTQTVTVRATQAGAIGWVIVIGAGAVLLGTVALRVRQVRRERSGRAARHQSAPRAATGAAEEPTSDTEDDQDG